MAVIKPKTRMISFRLSEEEYEYLRENSLNQGAHSVSDYARSILRRLMAGGDGFNHTLVEARINQLDSKMQELDHELRRLLRLVEQRDGHPRSESRASE
jgi:hypothetical protein